MGGEGGVGTRDSAICIIKMQLLHEIRNVVTLLKIKYIRSWRSTVHSASQAYKFYITPTGGARVDLHAKHFYIFTMNRKIILITNYNGKYRDNYRT